MNSSTLRRLAADHASLHTSELPPHYLFAPGCPSEMPEDLTQLTILLTGPQGTPYSQGLWKLSLKIPEDYPKSPPKAAFRTRIWHPNVEENSGSVCVDTLKKDWHSKLTLRDVLITITCLLIQPNPDSALNATAGHLIQDDYESFARQARLMTSIHANIPTDLRAATLAAKARGEDPGTKTLGDTDQRPTLKGKAASSSSVVMKKLPQRMAVIPSPPILKPQIQNDDDSASEEDNEESASKENDPMLSPSPVPTQTPRKPTFEKRPLSDLPTPVEPEEGGHTETTCLSPPDQNIINNHVNPALTSTLSDPHKASQLTERSRDVNYTIRIFQGTDTNGSSVSLPNPKETDDTGRPAKRVCSDDSKENLSAEHPSKILPQKTSSVISSVTKAAILAPRMSSAPSSLGTGNAKGKARSGLRRL